MELYRGRPLNMDNRTEKEIKVYDWLDQYGIEYCRVDHNELMTMEDCRQAENVLGAHICKNLFLRNQRKTKFYLLMMPGDKKFLTKELSKQINSARLSFAEADVMEKYLGVAPGSVTVFGLLNDTDNNVALLVDADLLNRENLGLHPCVNTSTVRIKTECLFDTFLKAVKHDYIKVDLTGL